MTSHDELLDNVAAYALGALPPAEAAFHPAEDNGRHELYLMSNDLMGDIGVLESNGVQCSEVHNERWGSITRIQMPGGAVVGLYQPAHALAVSRT